jgi:hypothetical protein
VSFRYIWLQEARENYADIKNSAKILISKGKTTRIVKLFKKVSKTLNLLKDNPKHPSLETHEYSSLSNPWNPNEKVYEAYVENNTPGAYRIFWCYGPNKGEITLIAITPHP